MSLPSECAENNHEINVSIDPHIRVSFCTGSEVSVNPSVVAISGEPSLSPSHDQSASADMHNAEASSLYEERANVDVHNDEAPFTLRGRRIVNIGHFLSSIIAIGVHAPFNCTVADMYPVSESRKGFISTIKLKCRMCGLTQNIETDDCYTDTSNVNTNVVTGMVSTGGGHSKFQEICAAIDMPCIGNDTWAKYHDVVNDSFHNAAWKLMSEAAIEEARIAREKGEVDKDGFPCITVVADGAWAKRSYKTKYDSLSGVAVIVGYETKKILFIGIRNKYCSFCDRLSRNPESETREHICFKNWSGSSTAMESDAIVEGFRRSVDMHGIKYTKLIGDGDSSVHRKLIEALPYGSSQLIEKIECRNHILRNYSCRLQTVCLNRKIGSIVQRNVLRQNLKRLRYAVTLAIKHRKGQVDQPRYRRVEELRKDIANGPHHVFGQHTACRDRGYFCNGVAKLGESNLVPSMKETGIFQEIQSAMHRVATNAASLIWDVDNNVAELYNSCSESHRWQEN